ncbi:MAG: response regulator [Rhizobiaceae bacterium]|nr:response regulator [Rhizobiaceae bacterium]
MDFDPTLRGNCILCAEDNEVNQMVLQHTLDEQSLPHVIVDDGKKAYEAWKALDPKVVLMDISMPVMNGIESIALIRMDEQAMGKRVPIIALTAHALKGDEERFIEAGADYYMSKPVNPNSLLDMIDQILNPPTTSVLTS